MVMEKEAVAVSCCESRTVTLNGNGPAAVGVPALRLGEAGGDELSIRIGQHAEVRVEVSRLSEAWETPF